jgi:hypothetical protein
MSSEKGEEFAVMTLRDYFAAHALPTFVRGYTIESAAKLAYEAADAMLAARQPPTDAGKEAGS